MEKTLFESNLKKIKKLIRDLNPKQSCFFAWVCAARALPFLFAKGILDFSFNGKFAHPDYLRSILSSLDVIAMQYLIAYTNEDNFATSSYTNSKFVHMINNLALNPADKHTAAIKYIASAIALAIDSDVYIKNFAYSSCARAAAQYDIDLTGILLYDLTSLIDEDYYPQTDIDIYGKVWEEFRDALNKLNCKYWGTWYARQFSKGLILDTEDQAEIELRLNVPIEIANMGAASIAEYLENVKRQGAAVYIQRETRLLILGSAGAGKTTLVRRLKGDESDPAPADSTHGVDTSVELDCNGTKAHVWDFGGQVIYHASHRCFMTANCIYILVVNARTEDNRDCTRIKYWLETIRIYSDNSAKVFIVINESDNRKQNAEDYDSFMHGKYASLVQGFFSFNISKEMHGNAGRGFLKELIFYIENIGHQAFGQNDNYAINEIKDLFSQNKQIIEAGELEKILKKNSIKTDDDQKRAIILFNTLGVALNYDFMEGYVLDPYWISHGVYLVIDYLQKNKSMFVNHNELDAVFGMERGIYPEGKRDYILDLMEHYKIGFRNKNGVRGLIVPCAASQFKPRDVIVTVEPDNSVTQVERDDLQEFPADFFYRYTCANENDIKKYGEKWAIWQTGMVLEKDNASALVELIENRRIEITRLGRSEARIYKKARDSH